MKNNFFKTYWLFITGATILLSSCEKSDDKTDIAAKNLKGMFVVCEGNLGTNEGDLTYYNEGTSIPVKNLYYSVNNEGTGDIVQSFTIADTLGFIVVNNSQKVVVVNMKDFTTVTTINGFSYPRSIVRADKKTMYLTNGNGESDNYIYSIDLTTLKKTDSLEVSKGPESIVKAGTRVYASISGGWNNDGNTVVAIDPETFTIVKTYEVASCPVDLAVDKDNNIWVYCKGVPDYSNYPLVSVTGMGICKINVSANSVNTFPFTSMNSPGTKNIAVSADGSVVFYINDGLYALPIYGTALPTTKVLNQSFYGVDIDPVNGNIICLDAVNSKAIVYDFNAVEQFNFDTGHYPNSVVFSN